MSHTIKYGIIIKIAVTSIALFSFEWDGKFKLCADKKYKRMFGRGGKKRSRATPSHNNLWLNLTQFIKLDSWHSCFHLMRLAIGHLNQYFSVAINYLFTTAYVKPTIRDNLIVPIQSRTIFKYYFCFLLCFHLLNAVWRFCFNSRFCFVYFCSILTSHCLLLLLFHVLFSFFLFVS